MVPQFNDTSNNSSNDQPEGVILNTDLELASTFLDAIGGKSYTFQIFDDREDKMLPAETFYGTIVDFRGKLYAKNQEGFGIFVTINQTNGVSRKQADITAIRALFVDLDTGIPTAWHLPPTIVVGTSENKGHAYWCLHEPSNDLSKFKLYQKRLIHHYKSDDKVHDLSRVMRLPGYWHRKNEPQMATLQHCDASIRYNLDEIVEGLEPHPDEAPKQRTRPQKTTGFKSIDDLLESVKNANEGNRNDILNKAAFAIGQRIAADDSLDEDELRDKLLDAADDCGLPTNEAINTINSGLNAGINNPFPTKEKPNNKLHVIKLLREQYDLRWNEMSYYVEELTGRSTDPETLEKDLAETDIMIGADTISRMIMAVAKEKSYHPVRNYLNSLDDSLARDEEWLNQYWKEVLGVPTDLEAIMLTKSIVAAVKRAFEPGCELDTMPVLHGKQGVGKTKFFTRLFSNEFFRTQVESGDETKELMSMYKSWCIEWGEFEYAYGKRGNAALKAFVTRCVDEYVPKYGRNSISHRRGFILVGTTNEDEFLNDPTGDRRFWIIRVTRKVNLAEIEQMRDVIWATALKLYKSGYSILLTDEQDEQRDKHNEQFRQSHVWFGTIYNFLTGNYCADIQSAKKFDPLEPLTTEVLLTNAIGKPVGQWTKKDEQEVGKCMNSLGYERSKQKRVNGERVRVWESSNPVLYQPRYRPSPGKTLN